MIFVGGAMVSLYADDPAADDIRPTGGIDLTIEVLNYSDWTKIQEQLASLKFYPDPFGHAICSYKYKNIPVDIMSSEDDVFGPSNRWYKFGFNDVRMVKVHGQNIRILPVSCFLATKFEAFNNRGKDYRTSHDIEDIIYVIDNNINIVEEVKNAQTEVLRFLVSELQKIINNHLMEEVITSHIHPLVLDERQKIIEDKINHILEFSLL